MNLQNRGVLIGILMTAICSQAAKELCIGLPPGRRCAIGSELKITCPKKNVMWIKPNEQVKNFKFNGLDGDKVQLIRSDLSEGDSGNYSCVEGDVVYAYSYIVVSDKKTLSSSSNHNGFHHINFENRTVPCVSREPDHKQELWERDRKLEIPHKWSEGFYGVVPYHFGLREKQIVTVTCVDLANNTPVDYKNFDLMVAKTEAYPQITSSGGNCINCTLEISGGFDSLPHYANCTWQFRNKTQIVTDGRREVKANFTHTTLLFHVLQSEDDGPYYFVCQKNPFGETIEILAQVVILNNTVVVGEPSGSNQSTSSFKIWVSVLLKVFVLFLLGSLIHFRLHEKMIRWVTSFYNRAVSSKRENYYECVQVQLGPISDTNRLVTPSKTFSEELEPSFRAECSTERIAPLLVAYRTENFREGSLLEDELKNGRFGMIGKLHMGGGRPVVQVAIIFNESGMSESEKFLEHLNFQQAIPMDTVRSRSMQVLEYFGEYSLLEHIQQYPVKQFCHQSRSKKSSRPQLNSTGPSDMDRQVEDSGFIGLTNGNFALSTMDLLSYAYQISSAMTYLSKKKIAYRYLACRNVSVVNNWLIKVTDGRWIVPDDVAEKTETANHFAWMSIESLLECFNNQPYTGSTYADVWSFGVLLYELFSLSKTPFSCTHPSTILNLYANNGRLHPAEYAPTRTNNLMKTCWSSVPTRRPTFWDCSISLLAAIADISIIAKDYLLWKLQSEENKCQFYCVLKSTNDNNGHDVSQTTIIESLSST